MVQNQLIYSLAKWGYLNLAVCMNSLAAKYLNFLMQEFMIYSFWYVCKCNPYLFNNFTMSVTILT